MIRKHNTPAPSNMQTTKIHTPNITLFSTEVRYPLFPVFQKAVYFTIGDIDVYKRSVGNEAN